MQVTTSVIVLLSLLSCSFALRRVKRSFFDAPNPLHVTLYAQDYHGPEPLFLTPYLDAGLISQGQKASRVYLNDTDVVSYSGFFTVNKNFDSNMFFWYFEPENGDPHAPILIWLQGGPGVSSLYGLFAEFGPFYIGDDMKPTPREYSWSKTFGLLIIDNPVGAGFSFTRANKGYATNQRDVGRNIHELLMQFYTLFPHLKKNELYVTGESYAGKYVPSVSYYLHMQNQKPTQKFKINLKGLAVGNGLSDPGTMTGYSTFMYQIGLLDRKQQAKIHKQELEISKLIQAKKWRQSNKAWHANMEEIMGYAGFTQFFNFLQPPLNISERHYLPYLNQNNIRAAIHVGNLTFHNDSLVFPRMYDDMTKSVRDDLITLLNNGYKVLYYNGQLDIVVAFPLTENFLYSLDSWKNLDLYKNATRSIWYVDGEVAGYIKNAANLQQLVIRNCGHMVPMDQPKWGFDMLQRFVRGIPY